MNSSFKNKLINAFVISAIITLIFITAITVIADLKPPLKNWLKDNFNHHWIGKGVLSVILFTAITIIIALIPKKTAGLKLTSALLYLFWTTVLGTFVIFGFFIYEYLKH
ncbi:MAG: hypothetical protein AAB772_02830 [Patescibacteria group bacterium]